MNCRRTDPQVSQNSAPSGFKVITQLMSVHVSRGAVRVPGVLTDTLVGTHVKRNFLFLRSSTCGLCR